MNRRLADDCSAASAAVLWNLLPQIAALPPPEGYERLREFIATAILAYEHGRAGWFDPERN